MRLAKGEDLSCEDGSHDLEEDDQDVEDDHDSDFEDEEDKEEYALMKEEQQMNTQVQRRRQTFILSRGLRKSLKLNDRKSDLTNRGYQTLEKVFMMDTSPNKSFGKATPSPNKLRHREILQKHQPTRSPPPTPSPHKCDVENGSFR